MIYVGLLLVVQRKFLSAEMNLGRKIYHFMPSFSALVMSLSVSFDFNQFLRNLRRGKNVSGPLN